MTVTTILLIVFNFVTHEDHTYKAIWMLDMGGHSESWVKDGDDHNTFVVVVIMTGHIVGHVLKVVTYHHLLLKICTCGTIRGCATIKINYKNKVICTQIITHWATIWICTTNWVNTVNQNLYLFLTIFNKPLINCAWMVLLVPKIFTSCVFYPVYPLATLIDKYVH